MLGVYLASAKDPSVVISSLSNYSDTQYFIQSANSSLYQYQIPDNHLSIENLSPRADFYFDESAASILSRLGQPIAISPHLNVADSTFFQKGVNAIPPISIIWTSVIK